MGPNPRIAGRPLLGLGGVAAAVLVGMIAFYYFDPGRGHFNFWDFVGLWFRELAFLGLVAVGLIGAAAEQGHLDR